MNPRTGSEVIFIAGIPRSGSTLVEQILASHPEVEGTNEINVLPIILDAESRQCGLAYSEWVRNATPIDWQRLGTEYLARTARWRERKPRFTDKNLVTLLDFCGLPFDPTCLDFHRTQRTVVGAASTAQVRQPLQRDNIRALRYGHLLDGLRRHLRDAGLGTTEK